MGITTQKSLKTLLQSKYSFTQPRSNNSIQLSCWKFTEQQLEGCSFDGQTIKWPFKFYTDEAYIIAIITNKQKQRQFDSFLNVKHKQQKWKSLGQLSLTLNCLSVFYSIYHEEITQYYFEKIQTENNHKYVKDNLQITLFAFSGSSLGSKSKIKLVSISSQLERYIRRGGIASISKLYHDYEQCFVGLNQIKLEKDNKNSEYYTKLSILLEENLQNTQDEEVRKTDYQKQLKKMYEKFSQSNLLKKFILKNILQPASSILKNHKAKHETLYKVIETHEWSSEKNLIIKSKQIAPSLVPKKQSNFLKKKTQVLKPQSEQQQQDPFQCEITYIDKRNKPQNKNQGNQSLSIVELSILQQKISNFISIQTDQDNDILLSDYQSIRQYNKCVDKKVILIINLGANHCYNYFMNDIQYIWCYIAPLPNKIPDQTLLFQYNIENIIFKITQKIISLTTNNKKGNPQNNKIIIHSHGAMFSDQNIAILIGYYITRYLYTYKMALDYVNKAYRAYKNQKDASFQLNKIYVQQLLNLEGRVLSTSDPAYGVSINLSYWRIYQVSNNHASPSQDLIARYIGQVNNLNQLTSLPNHHKQIFIALSHQIVQNLGQLIQKWEKDAAIKPPSGFFGIKVLMGKQFEFKDIYVERVKQFLAYLIKFELIDRSKHLNSFNNEFLFKFLTKTFCQNAQVQFIEKSFRKPQPFIPIYAGYEEENPWKFIDKKTLPFNPKRQKLVFKYPFLRPTWQTIKDDQYYYILEINTKGALVQILKGKNWIGLEDDKQSYFENIVRVFLVDIDEEKIWITQEQQDSLFGQQLDL